MRKGALYRVHNSKSVAFRESDNRQRKESKQPQENKEESCMMSWQVTAKAIAVLHTNHYTKNGEESTVFYWRRETVDSQARRLSQRRHMQKMSRAADAFSSDGRKRRDKELASMVIHLQVEPAAGRVRQTSNIAGQWYDTSQQCSTASLRG